jgi:glyoxylase-like metal-dependent hydrolase (beta-lactamase superfamily II)
MSIVKSFSVGNGDMSYIRHNSDNITIIDCNLDDYNRRRIINEIQDNVRGNDMLRFISTHPDEDHFCGIEYLAWNALAAEPGRLASLTAYPYLLRSEFP